MVSSNRCVTLVECLYMLDRVGPHFARSCCYAYAFTAFSRSLFDKLTDSICASLLQAGVAVPPALCCFQTCGRSSLLGEHWLLQRQPVLGAACSRQQQAVHSYCWADSSMGVCCCCSSMLVLLLVFSCYAGVSHAVR
jgi:hypothetical protein